jgi:hypothetical protein
MWIRDALLRAPVACMSVCICVWWRRAAWKRLSLLQEKKNGWKTVAGLLLLCLGIQCRAWCNTKAHWSRLLCRLNVSEELGKL